MKSLLALFSLLVMSFGTQAQGLPTIAAVKAVTDKAMEKVAAGELEGGMNAFKQLTIVPAPEFDAVVGQSKNQMPMIIGRFGTTIDYEFIEQRELGSSLASLTYIHRFDKHAMRWMFYLYRGKDGWVINTFRFDDQWPQLLDGK
jgi:hypothetical protein